MLRATKRGGSQKEEPPDNAQKHSSLEHAMSGPYSYTIPIQSDTYPLNYSVFGRKCCGWRENGDICEPTLASSGFYIPQRTEVNVKIIFSKTTGPSGKPFEGKLNTDVNRLT